MMLTFKPKKTQPAKKRSAAPRRRMRRAGAASALMVKDADGKWKMRRTPALARVWDHLPESLKLVEPTE
jgi:hypothetical protein